MKARKRMLISCATMLIAAALSGCTEQQRVLNNINQEADNFNIMRRVVVINTRTDKVEFEVIGRISCDISENKLNIIIEADDGLYLKHIVNLTQNNMYIVEDLSGAEVSKFKYEINYLPEAIQPFTIVSKD